MASTDRTDAEISTTQQLLTQLKENLEQALKFGTFPLLRRIGCAESIEPESPKKSSKTKTKTVPLGSWTYVGVCGLGGAISCGGTHLAIVPLDLVKCRMQVDPKSHPNLMDSFRSTISSEGIRGLARGWAPTALGYSAQGFAKFGFYELFKAKYGEWVGVEAAHRYRMLVYLAAGMSAEAIGDVALAPLEAVKVRMQTDPSAPSTMRQALPLMYKQEGLSGLFKGLLPLWGRQIPYTSSKFVCFEFVTEWLRRLCPPPQDKEAGRFHHMMLTFAAGCVAGVVCAVCSHPPDVIVSQMYNNANMDFRSAIRVVGTKGMWMGLRTRMLMIASIAALQLFVVDAVKVAFNLERPLVQK